MYFSIVAKLLYNFVTDYYMYFKIVVCYFTRLLTQEDFQIRGEFIELQYMIIRLLFFVLLSYVI